MPKASKALAEQFTNSAEQQQRQRQENEARAQAQATAAQKVAEKTAKAAADRYARKMKKAFGPYKKDIEPLVGALRSLPPNKDGLEFFVRADTHINDRFSDRPEVKSISMWLIYSEAAPDGLKQTGCETHGLYMPKKPHAMKTAPAPLTAWPYGAEPAQEENQDILISDNPVLHLRLEQTDGKEAIIQSHRYTESYHYAPNSRRPGAYRGDYACSNHIHDKREHQQLQEFISVIAAWVSDVAPERIHEVRAALENREAAQQASTLQETVTVLRPLTVHKRPKP
ncbi:MAG: hypothetical protein Q8K65_02890 [Alphaproteobacteria bacterium]|nr:hypothetical protein [Alphaproteobacteria bacterium]